jgi:hypothetical protein
MADFEAAVRNSFTEVFTGISVKGCFFHFSQNVNKKLQNVGLMHYYNQAAPPDHQKNYFRILIKSFRSLAFLPVNRVMEGYNFLIADVNINEHVQHQLGDDINKLQEVKDYLLTYYLNNEASIEKWNISDMDDLRTNNDLEGMHCGLKDGLERGSNFWCWVEALQIADKDQEIALAQMLKDGRMRPRRKFYRDNEERILNLKNDFRDGQIEMYHFLQSIINHISS